jgi:hypothetical protein
MSQLLNRRPFDLQRRAAALADIPGLQTVRFSRLSYFCFGSGAVGDFQV